MTATISGTHLSALLAAVNTHLHRYGQQSTVAAIRDAHAGTPDGTLVTDGNRHLFALYRDTVSPSADALIQHARDMQY